MNAAILLSGSPYATAATSSVFGRKMSSLLPTCFPVAMVSSERWGIASQLSE